MHEAQRVEQRRHLVGREHGAPPEVIPFARQREVEAQVEVRIVADIGRDFGEPGARHHDAARIDQALSQGMERRLIDRMRHADVVGVNDEQFGVGVITEPFGEGGSPSALVLGQGGQVQHHRQAGDPCRQPEESGDVHGGFPGAV